MSDYSKSLLETLQNNCKQLSKQNEELLKVNKAHREINGTQKRDIDNLLKVLRKTLLKLEDYNTPTFKQICDDIRKAIDTTVTKTYLIDNCPCNNCTKYDNLKCEYPCSDWKLWNKSNSKKEDE